MTLVTIGCGSSHTHEEATAATPGHIPDENYVKGRIRGDGDGDTFHGSSDIDDADVVAFGHVASPGASKTIASTVKNYYVAAAAGDGGTACSMLASRLAKSPRLGEIVEGMGISPSAPRLQGMRCAAVISLLFREERSRLKLAAASVEATAVRVSGNRGLVILTFKTTPERYMRMVRQNGIWKVDSLTDMEIV